MMHVSKTHKIAKTFKALTGINMRDYVDIFPDGDVMLNVVALETLVEPRETESIKDAAERKFGKHFVNQIIQLL